MKSSYSGKLGNCIDVERIGDRIEITETDTEDTVTTTVTNFRAFVQGVKHGEFDHLTTG